MKRTGIALLRILTAVAACLASALPCLAEDKPVVFASILPQRYFLEKVAGDRVRVSVMVEPGANPAVYEPKPSQMVALSRAKAYFAVGVPFEKTWLPKFTESHPDLLVVSTQDGIEKIPMKAHHHEEDHASHHSREGIKDPHVWLSPPLVKIQARNILEGLLKADPAGEETYRANCQAFLEELDELDAEIRDILQGGGGRSFMVFHPAWGYFARAYGLEQIPVELEGKEPKPSQLQEFIRLAREREIRVIFVQPQFSTLTAEAVAKAVQGRIAVVDPLAEDWADNLLEAAKRFKEVVSEDSP